MPIRDGAVDGVSASTGGSPAKNDGSIGSGGAVIPTGGNIAITDGSTTETTSGGGAVEKDGGAATGGVIDAPVGGAVSTGGTVAGTLGKNGDACTGATDCQSGFCVDKICCDTACGAACTACSQASTGKPDGTCAPVGAGKKDPRNTCVDETAKNECGADGFCDGAGACRKVGADHVCTTASCNGAVFTPVSTCDGKGACKTVAAQDCGSAACDVVDGCRTACTADKDCPATSYCNASTKRCSAKKVDGDTCSAVSECTSGFCVDGVCCNTACAGKCMACSNSLTSQKSGVCSSAKVGTDPHNSCEVDATNECGADGMCDGAGACRMTGTDHVCKPAACADGAFTRAATCDGKGACGTVTPESCGAFLCTAATGCQKSCTADKDCTGQNYCDAVTKTCAAKKDPGKSCGVAAECTSGFCVDGMCCNTQCAGACTSCKKTHTNAVDGTCASVSAGQDPYNSCADERATNKCGNTGMCDGAGACQKVDKSQSCGDASCSGSTFTPAPMCDGSGTCKPGSQTNCGNFQCSTTTGCLTTCADNGDCSSSTYCDTSLPKPVCVIKKGLGEACGTDGLKCASGRCVDGVCCDSACGASCYACNVAGSVGRCSAVAAKATDPKGICLDKNTTCGTDGTCDGSGGCYVPPVGTTGADCGTACVGSTKSVNSCDGKGACTGTSSPCDNNLVCANATSCLLACTSNAQCSSGACDVNGQCGTSCGSVGNVCCLGSVCGANTFCSNKVCTKYCAADGVSALPCQLAPNP